MCTKTIIDADSLRHFTENTKGSAGSQLRNWIRKGHGVIVYTTDYDNKFAEELKCNHRAASLLKDFLDNQKAEVIDHTECSEAERYIPDNPIRKSDDPHVLALAKVSNATVLFSCDGKLRSDFKDTNVLSKVGNRQRANMPDLFNQIPTDVSGRKRRHEFLQQRRCFLK